VPGEADKALVNSPSFVVLYFAFWAALMRALFVRAQLLPPTCGRCGMQFERRALGAPICTCGR
jgi:hypothetical protein